MPLRVTVDLGYRPELRAADVLAVVREGLGERYEVYDPGRLQVPDVIVKRSEREGVAVQLLQQRLRKRTRLRVYPLSPSIATRQWTPAGIVRQSGELAPLVDEVVRFLEGSEALRARPGG